MSLLADLLVGGGLGTAVSTVTGMLGGFITKRENRLANEANNAHELAMAEVDMRAEEQQLQATMALAAQQLDITTAEGQIAAELIDVNSEAAVNEIDAKGFAEAIKEVNKPTGYSAVDKFRFITRPALTWCLFGFMIYMFYKLNSMVSGVVAEDTDTLVGLYMYLVQSAIYLFVLAVLWWFMSRGEKSSAQIKALRD